MGRFIKLYDQILKWEWYKNPNTFRIFIHLLLRANYCDLRFEGTIVRRGQLVTSLPTLAHETQLSVQEVRTALNHLKSTGEITDTSTSKYRIITITNYDAYQGDNRQGNRQPTGEQQASNRRATASIESIEGIESIERVEPIKRSNKFTPPTLEEVSEYCKLRGNGINPQYFIDYYEARNWKLGRGTQVHDWKACIRTWERKDYTVRPRTVIAQDFAQRDYSGVQDELMNELAEDMKKYKEAHT